jgi:hypothetical protein
MNRRFNAGSEPPLDSLLHSKRPSGGGQTNWELDMNWKKTAFMIAVGATLSVGTVAGASADTLWQRHHPRREEVNNRLNKLNHRIYVERREGEITAAHASYLHREDRAIRHQERFDAHFNHGHLTKAEQRALNQEENGVSRQIGR